MLIVYSSAKVIQK